MLQNTTCQICFKEKKTHLHLVHCMNEFGPSSAELYVLLRLVYLRKHNCRFESKVRAYNVYGNRQSPSHDIAHHFSVLQQLRYICHGGRFDENERHLYLNTCIPIKVLSFKVWQGIERLVLV